MNLLKNKKIIRPVFLVSFLIFGLFFISGIQAQENRFFAGVDLQLNNHNKEGAAFGGGIMAGYQINEQFTAGLKTNFFIAAENLSSLEPVAFFRYNLPWLQNFFAQAEIGAVFYFYNQETYPAFSAGLAIGKRYSFTENFFVEAAAGFGYPFMWRMGVSAGYAFGGR